MLDPSKCMHCLCCHWCVYLQGELAFRVVSFTPWPVEPGYEGDRLRLGVGPINKTQLRYGTAQSMAITRHL